ncbi:MAG: hypothetical protein JO231_21750 [Acidobacteria bacterium]|nr:hypothetical protein [Acidobacteriota bacterium]
MLKPLITMISGRGVSTEDAELVAETLGISVHALCDQFALEIAQGYMSGEYSWEFGDVAMNGLYASAYAVGDFGLPDFAMHVYEAFDEGEYVHSRQRELDGKPRTKALLAPLLPNA